MRFVFATTLLLVLFLTGWSDTGDWSLAVQSMTSPALEQRKAMRRTLQQNGYVTVLREILRRDGPGALLAYLRLRGQIDLGMSHRQLYIYVPVQRPEPAKTFPWSSAPPSAPVAVPLHDDWTFPADPWDTSSTLHRH